MDEVDRTFQSEVDRILEDFELRRLEASPTRPTSKEDWKTAVHDFRDVARHVIVPTLRQIKNPLRSRGLRPYISNNTRQGLDIWLEVDAEQLPPRYLTFRLDAANRSIEIDGLVDAGEPHRLEVPIEGFDRDVVESAVVSFLSQLP